MRGARTTYDTLKAHGKRMFPIEFINDDGEVQPFDLFNETIYR